MEFGYLSLSTVYTVSQLSDFLGEYQDKILQTIVEEVNETYFLPDIQREFIWDENKSEFEEKVYRLFDSLMRKYPIGTLLFWQLKPEKIKELNIKVLKFIDNTDSDGEEVTINELEKYRDVTLVLDGQQRMTVLNLAFNGTFERTYKSKKRKYHLYFNLLSDPKNKEKEIDDIKYEFKLIENEENYFKEEIKTKDKKEVKIWHKVKFFKEDSMSSYRKMIYEKLEIPESDQTTIEDNLDKLIALAVEKISYYDIRGKSDEDALEIFVRVNSGGVTLTYSDLLFSKIKQYWKQGTGVDARSEFKDLLTEINGDSFDFDNDFLLKTSLVLIDKEIQYRIKNFDRGNVELIKEKWEKIKSAIGTVTNFLKNINFDKNILRSKNAVIPIIYYAYRHDIREIEDTDKNFDLIRKYLYNVLLNSVFGGSSDSLLTSSREILQKIGSKEEFPTNTILAKLGEKKNIQDVKVLLENIQYGTDRSRLILKILYKNKTLSKFQEDHMFSRDSLKGKADKDDINNIANLQPLSSPKNKTKGKTEFEVWVSDPNRSETYKKDNFVPDMESYGIDKYADFIQKRRDMIYNEIKTYF